MLGAFSVSITLSVGQAIKSNNEQILKSKGDLTVINVFLDESANRLKADKEKKYLDDTLIDKLKEIGEVDGVWAGINIKSKLLSGYKNRYQHAYMVGLILSDLEKFGYKIRGRLPSQTTIKDQEKIQVLVGQGFEYGFRDTLAKSRSKRSRLYNSPAAEYRVKKYDSDAKFIFKPPFLDAKKDEVFVGIPFTKNPEEEQEQFDDLIGPASNKQEKKNEKYKLFEFEESGRFNWDAVKDSDDWEKTTVSEIFAVVDISVAKDIIKQYNKLNHVRVDEKDKNKPLFPYADVRVKVKSINDVEKVSEKINKLGYRSQNNIEDVQREQQRTKSNQIVLGILGTISLFVAALSVTNTMITSMYERTSEIGVIKVLGCKLGNIQWMFLLESALLGLLGGTLGMLTTYGVSSFLNGAATPKNGEELAGIGKLLSTFMASMKYENNPWSTPIELKVSIVRPELWLLIIGGSMIITLIAGYLPALRASKISAIDAIKNT
jgi:hypothetical protein